MRQIITFNNKNWELPAVRNTDSVVGLLDKVTNNFIQPIDQNYLPTATNTIN